MGMNWVGAQKFASLTCVGQGPELYLTGLGIDQGASVRSGAVSLLGRRHLSI